VSVVIPAPPVGPVAPLLGVLPPVHEVIVVVGADAGTPPTLPRAARVVRQTRSGSGNALACGVAAATGDVVVTLPGDGSCDPADLPRFVTALREGADVVHGSRYLAPPPPGLLARCADRVVLWLMNVLFGCRPTDPGSGYRAFWRDTVERLGLPRVPGAEPERGDGPESEPLLTVRASLSGLHIAELPTAALGRAGSTLAPAVRALLAESRDRADQSQTAGESIVVLTGAPADPLVNPPHQADRLTVDGALLWPPPDPGRGLATLDRQDTPGAGFVERRRGERRQADRRRAGSPPVSPASPSDLFARRRWRDNLVEADIVAGPPRRRVQDRPDLRVINGEGRGSRAGRDHLRSV
jgi:hypothetical protein